MGAGDCAIGGPRGLALGGQRSVRLRPARRTDLADRPPSRIPGDQHAGRAAGGLVRGVRRRGARQRDHPAGHWRHGGAESVRTARSPAQRRRSGAADRRGMAGERRAPPHLDGRGDGRHRGEVLRDVRVPPDAGGDPAPAGARHRGLGPYGVPGGPTEDLLEPYARAKLNLRPEHDDRDTDQWVSIEANRLRASLDTVRRRGMRAHVAVALHQQTGQVAGLTEVVVPTHRPERADQYDTLVVPAHRGYGLGLAMKARMLLALRDNEPQTVDVQTWQTLEMEQMARVNTVLGFSADREWYEYEIEVPELLGRLSR